MTGKITVNEIREQQLAEAKARRQQRTESAQIAYYNNTFLMDMEVARQDRVNNVNRLKSMVEQMSLIPAQRLPQVGEIRVNAFPIGERYFGEELSLLLGVVSAVRSTFLDMHRDQAMAITGLDMQLIEDFSQALGEPAYFMKRIGAKVSGIQGSFDIAKALLPQLASAMGLNPIDTDKFTDSKYSAWFTNSELSAERKELEYHNSLKFDEGNNFTLTA